MPATRPDDPLRLIPDPVRDGPASVRAHFHALLDLLTDDTLIAHWRLLCLAVYAPRGGPTPET